MNTYFAFTTDRALLEKIPTGKIATKANSKEEAGKKFADSGYPVSIKNIRFDHRNIAFLQSPYLVI